jgi:Flp pilus assembly protein TadG
MKKLRSTRKGVVIVMLAAGAPFFFGLAGLSVDTIYIYAVKARLVTAVDACALAAARTIGRGQTEMNRIVDMTFNANFPADMLMTVSRGHTDPTITIVPGEGRREVAVEGTAVVPTLFMRMFGWDTLTVGANAEASRRDVNIMMVLDRSGSMSRAPGANPGPNAIDDMKVAAQEFVAQFDDARDKLGFVSFGSASRVDYAPQTSFKSATTSLIGTIYADNSGTNASSGLWQGYQALTALGEPNVLNIMVFFTDGVSTHFNGTFRTNTTPAGTACDNIDVDGVVGTYSSPGSDGVMGLVKLNPGPPPVLADQSDWITSPNCGFGNFDPSDRIPLLPLVDLYGNSVVGQSTIPYKNGSGIPTNRGLNIKPITENLTVNAAIRIRTGALAGIPATIYAIGLGGEAPTSYPADHNLMRRVANDPSSPDFASHSSEPAGSYVYAPSAAQLRQAFQQVASEIFRLIQ